MKNLKKVTALALVFALVFALSVFPTASAASYKDQADIDPKYQDAVDLMYEVEIMTGSGENFVPKNNLKRSELTKMLYVVRNRGITDPSPYLNVSGIPFKDYNNSHWAAGFINWAYVNKIVQGKAADKFAPDADVKVAEALKMALGVAGWRSDIEGYTGANWQLNVLRDAMEADLMENLLGLEMNVPISREQAAQLLQNMLFADVTSYTTGVNNVRGESTGETVGQKYLGLNTLVGVIVANEYSYLAPAASIESDEGEITLNNMSTSLTTADGAGETVDIPVVAPLDYVGREVKVFVKAEVYGKNQIRLDKITKVYGKPVLTNKDLVFEVKAADLKYTGTANQIKYVTDDKETYTATNRLYANYKRIDSGAGVADADWGTNAGTYRSDLPVTIVYEKGTRAIKFVLVKDYTFSEITVSSGGKVTAKPFTSGSTVFSNVAKDDIIEGVDLAVDKGVAMVAKIGDIFQLVGVEKVVGTVTNSAVRGNDYETEARMGGNWYKLSDIKGSAADFSFAISSGALNKEKNYYFFGGKMLGATEDEDDEPTIYAVLVNDGTYSAASERFLDAKALTSDGKEQVGSLKVFDEDGENITYMGGALIGGLYSYEYNSGNHELTYVPSAPADVAAAWTLVNETKGGASVELYDSSNDHIADATVGSKSIFFVYHDTTDEWKVYTGRNIPVMTGTTTADVYGLLVDEKSQSSLADPDTITAAVLVTTAAVATATGNESAFMLAEQGYYGQEGTAKDPFHYFVDPRGLTNDNRASQTYKAAKLPNGAKPANNNCDAPVGSVVLITNADKNKEISTYIINKPNAAQGANGVYRGYISGVDDDVIFVSRATTTGALDEPAYFGARALKIDSKTEYYVVDDDSNVTVGDADAENYETDVYDTETGFYNVTVIVEDGVVTQVYFVDGDAWEF